MSLTRSTPRRWWRTTRTMAQQQQQQFSTSIGFPSFYSRTKVSNEIVFARLFVSFDGSQTDNIHPWLLESQIENIWSTIFQLFFAFLRLGRPISAFQSQPDTWRLASSWLQLFSNIFLRSLKDDVYDLFSLSPFRTGNGKQHTHTLTWKVFSTWTGCHCQTSCQHVVSTLAEKYPTAGGGKKKKKNGKLLYEIWMQTENSYVCVKPPDGPTQNE